MRMRMKKICIMNIATIAVLALMLSGCETPKDCDDIAKTHQHYQNAPDGIDGYQEYVEAVDAGFVGTESEWADSVMGQ